MVPETILNEDLISDVNFIATLHAQLILDDQRWGLVDINMMQQNCPRWVLLFGASCVCEVHPNIVTDHC